MVKTDDADLPTHAMESGVIIRTSLPSAMIRGGSESADVYSECDVDGIITTHRYPTTPTSPNRDEGGIH